MQIDPTIATISIICSAALFLVALGMGIFFLVRYAQTRRTLFLVLGLLLTFILPGVLFCCILIAVIPSFTVAYGPPPTLRP